jgi:membrane-associated protease RseP (regulator of RpoE activity)
MVVLGIVLFALAIGVSIMLHEAGHMLTAKRYGMKVTQYFVGFGPTLWSFRRGETEYGVKAIPAGGFVKIIGMTPQEDVEPADQPRAFWRQPLGKRTVVLSAGSITHFVLGFLLLYLAAVTTGLPNLEWQRIYDRPTTEWSATVGEVQPCLRPYSPDDDATPEAAEAAFLGECREGDAPTPAAAAGLQPGDTIVRFDGTDVATYAEVSTAIQGSPEGSVEIVVLRDGGETVLDADLVRIERNVGTAAEPVVEDRTTLGIIPDPAYGIEPIEQFGPVDGVAGAVAFSGEMVTGTFRAIANFPSKVLPLLDAIRGEQRDPEGPISVVGASRAGGDALGYGGSEGWAAFLLILASLNIFIGIFNLFPLLPLDGGHIAVAWYEAARSRLARMRGRPDPGRVDYAKLMPLTYVVVLLMVGVSLLAITADIVNPIRLFQ